MSNHPVVMRGRCRASTSSEHRDVGRDLGGVEKSPQRRNQTPNRRDRGVHISTADVPGPAAEPPSPPRCLPSPWSWFPPPPAGRKCRFPGRRHERGGSTGDAPVRHKKRGGAEASVHGGAQPRCQIPSGGGLECSGWEKGGGIGGNRGRGGESRAGEGAPRVSKPNDVRAWKGGGGGGGTQMTNVSINPSLPSFSFTQNIIKKSLSK